MLKLDRVQKSYKGRCVLNINELAFNKGGRYAIIGPNGSGKSTLLRVLAGVLATDSGQVIYEQGLKPQLGYMPQKPYAYGFSVLRNVSIAIKGQMHSKQAALEALRKVGMERFAHAKGNSLSGGEAQRVALARMIALPRPLLLLDEPTSATDIAGSESVENALLDYCKQTGCTLILATHSLAQAQRVAETIIMLDHGNIAEYGPVNQVLFYPQSEEGQKFIRHWKWS